jgi:hypothetical protein
VSSRGWFTDLVRIAPGLRLSCLDRGIIGLEAPINPYQLPESDRADVILICSEWYKWLETFGSDVVDAVFARLRDASRAIVGIEGHDLFSLAIPPDGLERLDLLIKAQGLLRQPALYNHKVGAFFPGGNWIDPQDPRAMSYSDSALRKLRLSLPCFTAVVPSVRHAIRAIKPGIGTRKRWMRALGELGIDRYYRLGSRMTRSRLDVHCAGALTNEQRYAALRALSDSSLQGKYGISVIPRVVYGTSYLFEDRGVDSRSCENALEESMVRTPPEHTWREGARELPLVGPVGGVVTTDPAHLRSVENRLEDAGLKLRPVSRMKFAMELARHKAVLAMCGYGELTHRHGEALRAGRVLISQSLEHADTMFPFRVNENVVFVQPNLQDLPSVLEAIHKNDGRFSSVGDRGLNDWRDWSGNMATHLRSGITRHVAEALERA